MNKKIIIGQYISIKELAEKLQVPIVRIIGQLMKNGLTVTINDTIDFDTAEIVADDFDFELEKSSQSTEAENLIKIKQPEKQNLKPRPPVITIMGHVDHGKTTLLDYIRKTNVVAGEAGGITQNITAYQVSINVYNTKREITFIDTPGHKAFSKMREHGTSITDVVILVVAADDGVKPQTIEVIEYIKASKVPVIVALNKIDTPGANPENVKRQLSEHGLISEEWGGSTIIVPLSAKTGRGVDNLLEHIALQADLLNLKAEYDTAAQGVIIESHQQKGLGAVALILVTEGILEKNDIIILGNSWGKIKNLENTVGGQIEKAMPSQPVRIAGIKTLPEFGEYFTVVKTEKEAKQLVENQIFSRNQLIKSIDKNEYKKSIKLILKAETRGTLEALTTSVKELENNQVKVVFTKVGIGDITDSDADLAYSTNSTILAFRVGILPAAKKVIELKDITIYQSEIIYELLEKITEIINSMTEIEYEEVQVGRLKILKVFYVKGSHQVIGGEVISGKIVEKELIRISKKDKEITGKIESLQIEKTNVDEVTEGKQCGLSVDIDTKLEASDIIEIYTKVEKKGN